jgi:hypothetical protein
VGVRICGSDTPEDRARFETEARTLARVNEPGVARVYDAGRHGEAAFVVLQLVPATAEEITAPVAVVDPTGDVTRVIGGPDATAVLPVVAPLPVDLPGDLPVAARSRAVPVWGMVVGLAAVLVAILVFASTRGPDAPAQSPSVVESTSTSTTAVRVRTTVRAVTPTTTATTAPTTTQATVTTLEAPSTTIPATTVPAPAASPGVG